MPKFLGVHPMKGTTEKTLKQLQILPKDEFGVTHVNILFNPEAPDKDAVQKHNQKIGIKCELEKQLRKLSLHSF
jgi:hypothetical protein